MCPIWRFILGACRSKTSFHSESYILGREKAIFELKVFRASGSAHSLSFTKKLAVLNNEKYTILGVKRPSFEYWWYTNSHMPLVKSLNFSLLIRKTRRMDSMFLSFRKTLAFNSRISSCLWCLYIIQIRLSLSTSVCSYFCKMKELD